MVGIAGVGAILAMGLTMLTMALGAPLPVRFGATGCSGWTGAFP